MTGTLSTGTLTGAQVRVIRALAAEVDSPGKLSIYRLPDRAKVADDQNLLRLLYRLERDGWVWLANVDKSGRPGVVQLTDAAWRVCRTRGWGVGP